MERCYTAQEVAERYNVKLITVWDWLRKKELPALKVGKSYAIRPEDIKAFESAKETVPQKSTKTLREESV